MEGYWAPTKATWGVENRTTSFRVIPGSAKSTRLETRISGADVNPYIALSAALGSGFYGIEKKLKLQSSPVTGNGYAVTDAVSIPKNLYDAAIKMQNSKVAREIFGDGFVDHYTETRIWEWKQFQQAVTNWEIERYFEII